MKQMFFLIATLMLNGCMQPGTLTPRTMTPCKNVPKEVTGWFTAKHLFQSAFGDAASYDNDAKAAKWELILDGTHPEIKYLGKGKMRSKKYGWALNVKYNPYILYENSNCIVIDTVPGLDHLFTSVLQTVYIVDKRTGKVVWRYQTTTRQGRKIDVYAVVGHTFYFRTFKSKDIYCVNLDDFEESGAIENAKHK